MFKPNPILIALAAVLSLGGLSAQAATTQQNKMKQCNLEAKGKKGAERKALMKTCLSSKAAGTSADGTPVASAPEAKRTARGDAKQAVDGKS